MKKPKFKVGDIVYVREAFRQNQNVVGCGVITEVKPVPYIGEFYYIVKFVNRYEKNLKDCLKDFLIDTETTINEPALYKIDELIELFNDLETELDAQLNHTEWYLESIKKTNNK